MQSEQARIDDAEEKEFVKRSDYDKLMAEKELWEGRSQDWEKVATKYKAAMKELDAINRKYRSVIDDLSEELKGWETERKRGY